MMETMDYTLPFEKLDKDAVARVGGKNASLGEMIRAGIRVPPGFAVTTDSYHAFLQDARIAERIYETLRPVDPNDVEALNSASAQVQSLIRQNPVQAEIRKAVTRAYTALCEQCGIREVPVAVRSSATAEDLPTASFAGQQDTYLWIRGGEAVVARVQDCWASLFTPRAIAYRMKNDFPHEKVLISVGVQKMVNSKAAGVMFTLNPTDGDRSKVVIEGSWGLGETVVSGSVNPDKFIVDKIMMEINEKTISSKHIQCVFDPDKGCVADKEVDEELKTRCCLEDPEIRELAAMGLTIEAHYKRPMDIEWAIDGDYVFPESLFIVQARPETVWSQRKKTPVLGKKSGYQLLMEQAMTRIKLK
ncbi:MAG: phenylphosphate synthase subunit beta [Deltaproteobacteria bacterium]|nr:phenylphosphate synthase subunit beta [Deltaproteobacteria bacterium]